MTRARPRRGAEPPRPEGRGPRLGSRRAAPILGAACLALACWPVEPLESLEVTDPVLRFGQETDYLRLEGVSRPVIATRVDTPTEVPVGRVPAARLLFAAAAPGQVPPGASPTIPCEVQIAGHGRDPEPVACLDVGIGASEWEVAEVSVPPLEAGRLTFHCEREPGDPWVFWAAPLALPHQSDLPPPIVVVLSIDALRPDYVTGFEGPPGLTPNLAALGDEGVRFESVASEGVWSVPSYYALLYSRIYGFPTSEKPLVPLAHALGRRGFVTVGLTGGGFVGSTFKFELGFDVFREYAPGEDDLQTLFEDARKWIERSPNTPLFLFLHTYAVDRRPDEEIRFYQETTEPFAVFEPTAEELASIRKFYEVLVRDADAALGPFVEVLRAENERRPVLLLVVSAHGHALGEHGRYGEGYTQGTLYDEVVHVPVIAWGPRVVRGGRRVSRPMGLVDVAPTLLEALHLPEPASMRGQRLWPLWSGGFPPGGVVQEIPETWGAPSAAASSWSLRSDTHKLIVPLGRGEDELYSLADDPGETRDLAQAEPRLLSGMQAALRARLEELGVDVPHAGLPRCPACDPREGELFWTVSLAEDAVSGAKPPRELSSTDLERLRELSRPARPPEEGAAEADDGGDAEASGEGSGAEAGRGAPEGEDGA